MRTDDDSLVNTKCHRLRVRKARCGKKKHWVVFRGNKFVTAFRSKQEAVTWLYVKEKKSCSTR